MTEHTDEKAYTERTEYETRMEWRGCSCGHPGLGCYCQSVRVRTGRFRVIRTFADEVGEWQEPVSKPPGGTTS